MGKEINKRHLQQALEALLEMGEPCSYTRTPSGISYHVRALGKEYHSYVVLMADIARRENKGGSHALLLADLEDRIAAGQE